MMSEQTIPSDDELVARTQAGDDDAFRELVQRHARRVHSIVGAYVRSPADREDLSQEVFIKVYYALHSYRQGERFERWLAKIAVNACYDRLRAIRRRPELLFTDMSEEQAAWLDAWSANAPPNNQDDLHQREAERELAERLLATLNAEDRMVLTMLETEGWSVQEIAEVTGWSKAKIKMRAFRARQKLRRSLQRLTVQHERLQKKARSKSHAMS